MKILISSSDGKYTDCTSAQSKFDFEKQVKKIVEMIDSYEGDYGELFDVKDDRILDVLDTNLDVFENKTTFAINRYRGKFFDSIEYDKIENKEYFNKHVRIMSAMFGLLKPESLIPNYRLKMSQLNLVEFWKPIFTKDLAKDDLIIDCLTELHRTAYSHPNRINVDFYMGNRLAGHHANEVKGKFIRFLCENEVKDISKFSDFSESGYSWNGSCFVLPE